MLPKVFIDGHTGTTGLRIHQWMAGREDVELLTLPQELRRNPEDRRGQSPGVRRGDSLPT